MHASQISNELPEISDHVLSVFADKTFAFRGMHLTIVFLPPAISRIERTAVESIFYRVYAYERLAHFYANISALLAVTAIAQEEITVYIAVFFENRFK